LLLAVNGTTTFGTSTSGSSAGIVNQVFSTIPGVRGAGPDRGTFQVRVWDTRAGAISTWDQLMLPENNGVLRGYSDLFTVPYTLGDSTVLQAPPHLQGLQSFNLFIVPEPSVWALALVGAGFVFVNRKYNTREK
jgi:PEP-CTERM motif